MGEITRAAQRAYERTEGVLGRSWPVWVLVLLFYAATAYVLLFKISLPSPAHLIVYSMALAIIIITLMKVEWALLGLVLMIPFARPGFTIGELKMFHISAFNVAVAGVWLVYIVRYFADRELAAKGPLFRRTPLDTVLVIFLLLVTVTSFANLNYNVDGQARALILTYMKEQIFYAAWFYLVLTLLRKPGDLRRFAIFFALSGVLVAIVGLTARISGAIETAGAITDAEVQGGVAGGRTGGVGEGGWFGLGHPNLFAAFLIMVMPFWFYATDHLKRFAHRLLGNVAIVFGFVALLYTYSRAAWGGIMAAILSLSLRDFRALRRTAIFLILFAVVAQVMTVSLVGMGVAQVIEMRFEELSRSQLSARPEIFAAALVLIKERPFVGIGMGTFMWHASVTFTTRIHHAHNVFLTYASELGIPAALVYVIFIGWIFVMAVRNLRTASIPGYGFISQASFVGLFAVLTLMMFDHLFADRNVGHAFYTLLAIIVSQRRMIDEKMFPGMEAAVEEPPSKVWIDS